MTAEIVDLETRRRIWAVSTARCGACGKTWVTTWPALHHEAKPWGWECPGCGLIRARALTYDLPVRDEVKS